MGPIIVYGNCQSGPIGRLIERGAPNLILARVPPVHTIKEDEIEFVHDAFKSAEIILSQPIGDHFGPLSTSFLKGITNADKWITFPSIYFNGYFPYLRYLRNPLKTPLRGFLSDYHDERIVKSFTDRLSVMDCVEVLTKSDPQISFEYFNKSIQNSTLKEKDLSIKVMDFIVSEMRNERAFHTYNHPANKVLWFVVNEFFREIGVTSLVQHPPVNQFLNEVEAAIPIEFSSVLRFDISDSYYKINGQQINNENLVRNFYELYESTNDFSSFAVSH